MSGKKAKTIRRMAKLSTMMKGFPAETSYNDQAIPLSVLHSSILGVPELLIKRELEDCFRKEMKALKKRVKNHE